MNEHMMFDLKAMLRTNIVSVEVTRGDDILVIPYTTREDLTPGSIPDNGDITMFNTVLERYEHVDPSTIRQYCTVSLSAWEDTSPAPEELNPVTRSRIKECQSVLNNLDIPDGFNKLMSPVVQYHTDCSDVMTLMEVFNCDIDCLTKNDKEFIKAAQSKYLDLIRKHREDAFKELDQLEEEAKKEGSSQDDLADIDTIKQMFRDIPQDIDVSQYNTIKELIEFWPSLLLPGPKLAQSTDWLESNPVDEKAELKDLLDDITDISELQYLLGEAKQTKTVPDYAANLLKDRIDKLQSD